METQFLQLPTKLLSITESNKFMCFLTYAIIDNQKTIDKTSCISFDKMIVKYGIDKKTSRKAVQTLKEYNLIDYKKVDTGRTNKYTNEKEYFNKYTFPLIKGGEMKYSFTMVETSIINLDISTKERGVLLGLYLLSTDTKELPYTVKELASKLGITDKTMKKHLDTFININLIHKTKIGWKLGNQLKDMKENMKYHSWEM